MRVGLPVVNRTSLSRTSEEALLVVCVLSVSLAFAGLLAVARFVAPRFEQPLLVVTITLMHASVTLGMIVLLRAAWRTACRAPSVDEIVLPPTRPDPPRWPSPGLHDP